MKRSCQRLMASLSLAALLCGTLSTPAVAGRFQDVPDTHWAAAAVAYCAEQGWLQGKSADTFGVGQPMTRAGFAVALSRFFGWESQGEAYQIFSDVPEGAWYEPALRACYEHGAVTRQTAEFRPGDAITREELAVMLIRALGYGQLAGLAAGDTLPFRDVTSNQGHIAMAYELGLTGGVSADSFAPERAATREQAAMMLKRLADRLSAGTEETMAVVSADEEVPELTGCGTVILLCGRLTGGQKPVLSATPSDAQRQTMEAAREMGCRVLLGISVPSGVLGSGAEAGRLLSAAVDEGGYDGVYLDIAQSGRDSGRELAAFVREVRAEMPDAWLCAAVEASIRGDTAKDYTVLGQTVDQLVLRVDGCTDTDGEVPVLAMEPPEHIYEAISVLNDQVPSEKLVLFLTAEGQTRKNRRTASLDGESVAALEEKGRSYYSDRYACAYLETEDSAVWYLNEQALAARRQLLRCFGVNAVCFSTLHGTITPASEQLN